MIARERMQVCLLFVQSNHGALCKENNDSPPVPRAAYARRGAQLASLFSRAYQIFQYLIRSEMLFAR